MSRKEPFNSFGFNSYNPFLNSLITDFASSNSGVFVTRTLKATEQNATTISNKTLPNGETIKVFHRKELVDTEAFVKMYQGQLRKFHDLSIAELDLLELIVSLLPVGSDLVLLHPLKAAEMLCVTKTTVYSSFSTLLKRGLIAKGAFPERFYVNPSVIFKGDRIAVIVETIKKS